MGAYEYVSMLVSVGMSWNLGVNPARTTLSEDAMHSIMSENLLTVFYRSLYLALTSTEVRVDVVGLQKHSFTHLKLYVIQKE